MSGIISPSYLSENLQRLQEYNDRYISPEQDIQVTTQYIKNTFGEFRNVVSGRLFAVYSDVVAEFGDCSGFTESGTGFYGFFRNITVVDFSGLGVERDAAILFSKLPVPPDQDIAQENLFLCGLSGISLRDLNLSNS